jgi:hypothetical protein
MWKKFITLCALFILGAAILASLASCGSSAKATPRFELPTPDASAEPTPTVDITPPAPLFPTPDPSLVEMQARWLPSSPPFSMMINTPFSYVARCDTHRDLGLIDLPGARHIWLTAAPEDREAIRYLPNYGGECNP